MWQRIDKALYQQLTDKVFEAASKVFSECQRQAPDESFYGFAFLPDCDVTSFYWTASSEESLHGTSEKWLEKTNKKFPEQNYTMNVALNLYRYEVADWTYHDSWLRESSEDTQQVRQAYLDAGQALHEIWESFEQIPMSEEARFRRSDSIRKKCLKAIVKGLQQFDQQYKWSPIDRNKFILLIYITDPDNPREIAKIARQLNPSPSYKVFRKQYQIG